MGGKFFLKSAICERMNNMCMHITYCPIDIFVPGERLNTYGGQEIGDEPRFALIAKEVPNAIINRENIKTTYLRSNSLLPLVCFSINFIYPEIGGKSSIFIA